MARMTAATPPGPKEEHVVVGYSVFSCIEGSIIAWLMCYW
jgi:hypothetical protein